MLSIAASQAFIAVASLVVDTDARHLGFAAAAAHVGPVVVALRP